MVVSTPSMTYSPSARLQPHQAFGAGLAEHDELADQAVVIGRDAIAGIERRIDPHAEAARHMHGIDAAGRRREGRRVLGIDPAFDGVAGEDDVASAHI